LGSPDNGTDALLVCAGNLETSMALHIRHPTSAVVVDESEEVPWATQASGIHRQFSTQYDLNGKIIDKIWGMASCHNIATVCTTVCPSDSVIYPLGYIEKAHLVFGKVADPEKDEESDQRRQPSAVREEIASWALNFANKQPAVHECDKRLLYAMLACTLTSDWKRPYHDRCISAIEQLHVDLQAERYLCEDNDILSENGSDSLFALPARSNDKLQDMGNREVFEVCNVCGEGFSWESPDWAYCSNGHECSRFCCASLHADADDFYSQMCFDIFDDSRTGYFKILFPMRSAVLE